MGNHDIRILFTVEYTNSNVGKRILFRVCFVRSLDLSSISLFLYDQLIIRS